MFTKISLLVPTRGRPLRLRKMLESFQLTADDKAEVIFRVDDDDFVSQQALRGYKVIIGPRLSGYRSLPIFFNQLASAATGDVLMCGNDDMVFKTVGWPQLVLDAANKYPDGVFNLGVKTHNETHYPFSIVSKLVVGKLGFIFDPRIFWGDIYLRDVMAAFGRCEMLPHVEVDHDWMGHEPDSVFMDGNDARTSDWMAQHAEAVDDAVRWLR
jgi:hypothetical protein